MADDHREEPLKDRLERAASAVFAEHLGLELDPDGKLDPDDIDREALRAHSKDVILGVLNAFYRELKVFRAEQEDAEGATAGAKGGPGATGAPKGKGAAPPEAPIDTDLAIERLKDKMAQSFSQKLHALTGVPLDANGVIDEEALEDDTVKTQVAQRLLLFAKQVGTTVDEIKARATPFLEALEESAQEERASKAGTGKASAFLDALEHRAKRASEALDASAGGATGEDAEDVDVSGDHADVIDFEAWKQTRYAPAARFGQSLQDTLNSLLEGALGEADSDGNVRLQIDQKFIQEHAPELIRSAIQGLIPPKIDITLPPDPAKAAPAEGSGEGEAPKGIRLSVNVDFPGLIRSFFSRVTTKQD